MLATCSYGQNTLKPQLPKQPHPPSTFTPRHQQVLLQLPDLGRQAGRCMSSHSKVKMRNGRTIPDAPLGKTSARAERPASGLCPPNFPSQLRCHSGGVGLPEDLAHMACSQPLLFLFFFLAHIMRGSEKNLFSIKQKLISKDQETSIRHQKKTCLGTMLLKNTVNNWKLRHPTKPYQAWGGTYCGLGWGLFGSGSALGFGRGRGFRLGFGWVLWFGVDARWVWGGTHPKLILHQS